MGEESKSLQISYSVYLKIKNKNKLAILLNMHSRSRKLLRDDCYASSYKYLFVSLQKPWYLIIHRVLWNHKQMLSSQVLAVPHWLYVSLPSLDFTLGHAVPVKHQVPGESAHKHATVLVLHRLLVDSVYDRTGHCAVVFRYKRKLGFKPSLEIKE